MRPAHFVRAAPQGVPLVWALSRKKMGEIWGRGKRVSAVALMELNGVHEPARQLAEAAEAGRKEWTRLKGARAADGGSAGADASGAAAS